MFPSLPDLDELHNVARLELWQLGEAMDGKEPERTPRLDALRDMLTRKRYASFCCSSPVFLLLPLCVPR